VAFASWQSRFQSVAFSEQSVAARVLHRLATDPEFGPCFTGDANRRGHGACRGSDD
jgi:hypothetical protein